MPLRIDLPGKFVVGEFRVRIVRVIAVEIDRFDRW